MRDVRFLAAAAAAFALLAVGCGGSKPAATADTDAPAPPNAGFYATLNTDRGSAQWQQAEELLKQVPGAEGAIDKLLADALGEAGLDWEDDVAPALGAEVAVVLPRGSSQPVALAQPEDDDELEALLEQSDEKLVTREIEGWTAVAESEATLDAYEAALKTGTLSDQPDFAEAMADLPEDALARVFVDGSGLSSLGANLGGISGGLPSLGDVGTLGLAVVAEDDGARLTGSARQQEGLPASFSPKLLPQVPADALLAATFKGGNELNAQMRKALGGAGPLLEGFQQSLGVSLDDVVSLLSGECVLYVRPGIPIPELTVVLQQMDAKQAATLDALFRALAKSANAQLTTATENGVHVTRLAFGPVSLSYGQADGLLFVTTGRGGIADFRGGNAKLIDDAAFETAAERVGYTGSTSGFVYADVDGLVPLLKGLAGLAGGSSISDLDELTNVLGAIDSLALNVETEGIEAKLEGFLAIR
jgi:Protein of unknown function (DUF3352)